MIKVLVAEDEPPIMRANIAIIEAANKDFKVIATANNGKRAIEELEKQKIDVVFTDIKMPIMDGLELVEYIKEKYPNIITVITSGYSDFEYARRGIEFKVQDYILKPVSKVKISTLLENIKSEISKRNHEKKKNIFLEKNEKVDSELSDSEWTVILVCAGVLPIYENDMMLPAAAFWDKICLKEIISDIIKEGQEYVILRGSTVAERVIVIESKENESPEISEKIFNELRNKGITITLSYKTKTKMGKVDKATHKLRENMRKRIILTQSQILRYDELVESTMEPKYSKKQVELIGECLRTEESTKLKSYILEIFSQMEEGNATQEDMVSFFDMIINYCYFNTELVKKKINRVKKDLYETIINFIDYESTAEDVAYILSEIIEDKPQLIKQPKLINEIQEYLKANYKESISNTVLSKKFGFVPSYISRVFKQYNDGISPGEYLSNYRIEKAKKIMQDNPELMVKEIADMVGFNDAYYFSKTFKKKTGMWPTKYYGNKKISEII